MQKCSNQCYSRKSVHCLRHTGGADSVILRHSCAMIAHDDRALNPFAKFVLALQTASENIEFQQNLAQSTAMSRQAM